MIRVLPKHIADKIAAGEVVDRPVSIVKELLENAIDAGADTITVEVRNGGKTYIRVADNGCGIPKEEVSTAFLRHATSKVQQEEDLTKIMTLGFRGEALSSIAAVSRIQMITKPAQAGAGVSVRIEGGEITSIADVGCPDGTTIIISDLFYNTPARLKFMKSDATESTQIISLVSRMALACSHMKIRMISNGDILFYTSGKGNIQGDIITIFGKETGEKLIHYNAGEKNNGEVDIEIFISPQDQTRSNRKRQVFFVNGRYVSSKLMENAVAEAYKGRIPEGRFPVVFLFYRADPSDIDVNIHPNKKEIRFSDEKKVYDLILNTVTRALDTVRITPEMKISPPESRLSTMENKTTKTSVPEKTQQTEEEETPPEYSEQEALDIPAFFAQKREEETLKKEKVLKQEEKQTKYEDYPEYLEKTPEKAGEDAEDYSCAVLRKKEDSNLLDEVRHPEIANIQISGAVFHTYIIGYDTKYFYLIDQHAAHERVFYEHFLNQFQSETKAKQTVMDPILVEIPVEETESEKHLTDYLQKCGFEIMSFGPKLYRISAIPAYMGICEAEDFLRDIMDHADENMCFQDQKKIGKIIVHACKKAVKANDNLTLSEMKHLMADLAKTTNPFSCPHGRPVFLKLSKQEIEKMFRRS